MLYSTLISVVCRCLNEDPNPTGLHSSVGKIVHYLRSFHNRKDTGLNLFFFTLLFMFSLNNYYKPNHLK